MKNSFRLKTDLKSTVVTQECEESELQQCITEVLKHLCRDELYPKFLNKVLNKLALKPTDLLPVRPQQIRKASKKQVKQLLKEDVEYYLANKCAKLEARRRGFLTEVIRQYQQMENAQINSTNFSPIKTDVQVTKRRGVHRYQEVDDGQRIIRNEQRRMRVLKRNRLQEVSQSDTRNKAKHQLKRKLSQAESRREKYRIYVESLKSSPAMSPQQHRRKMQGLQEGNMRKLQKLSKQLMSKLDRASKSRDQMRQHHEAILRQRNQQLCQKVKSFKETSYLIEQHQTKQLRNEIQQDIEAHLKQKAYVASLNIKNIKTRRSRQQRKIESIRVSLKKREEKQLELSTTILKQRQQQVRQNKREIRQRMESMMKSRQKLRDCRLEDIYRRRSMADLDAEKKRAELQKYRLDTEVMVSQRRHQMDVDKRRNHIIQQIKVEISTLNVNRQNKLEELKVEKTKEELSFIDRKHQELEQRKNQLYSNRQKLKIVFRKRKRDLDLYFDSRVKDFSSLVVNRNRNYFLTQSLHGRSIDLEEIQKTRDFKNLTSGI